MTHTTARRLILEKSLRDTLSPADETALRDHLASCPACRRFSSEMCKKGREILPVPTPRPSFESDLFKSIMRQAAPLSRIPAPPARRFPRLRPALAAAASIPAILVSFLLARGVLSPEELSKEGHTALHVEQPADPATLVIARETGLPARSLNLSLEQGTRRIVLPETPLARTAPRRETTESDKKIRDTAEPDKETRDTRYAANLPRPSVLRGEAADTPEDTLQQGRIASGTIEKKQERGLHPDAKQSLLLDESAKTAADTATKGTSNTKATPTRTVETTMAKTAQPVRPQDTDQTPRIRYQPTARLHVEVPDAAAASRINENRIRLEGLMAGLLPEGTSISIHPVIKTSRPALTREIPATETRTDPWRICALVLWLIFEAGIRVLNIVAGSARRSQGLGRYDTALGAILGTLWLPVVLVRLVSIPAKDQRSSSPER